MQARTLATHVLPCSGSGTNESAKKVKDASTGDGAIETAIGVANVTNGDTKYVREVVDASTQTCEFEVYYNNRLPDGSKIVKDLTIGVDMPRTPGVSHEIPARVTWDGGEATSSVEVDTRSDMCVAFLPGSVVWRHNVGPIGTPEYVDRVLPDSAVLSAGETIDDPRPRYDYAGTVSFLARVVIPATELSLSASAPSSSLTPSPLETIEGNVVDAVLSVKAAGNVPLTGLVARLPQSNGWSIVKGSTTVQGSDRRLEHVPDLLVVAAGRGDSADNGLNLGDLDPGDWVNVGFKIRVAGVTQGTSYPAAQLQARVSAVGVPTRVADLTVSAP